MPVNESKRRANDKWDKDNMSSLGCKIRKDRADAFRAYCVERGHTVNEELRNFVYSCIGVDTSGES